MGCWIRSSAHPLRFRLHYPPPCQVGIICSPTNVYAAAQRGKAICPRMHSWAAQNLVPAQPRGLPGCSTQRFPKPCSQNPGQDGTTPRSRGQSDLAAGSPQHPVGALETTGRPSWKALRRRGEGVPSWPTGKCRFPSFRRGWNAHIGRHLLHQRASILGSKYFSS